MTKKPLQRFLIQKVCFAKNISDALKNERKGKIVEVIAIGDSKDKLEPMIGFAYPTEFIRDVSEQENG